MSNEMTASEALFGFMGWLTSRKEVTPNFSSRHDAANAAELVGQFCKENNLSDPRDGWENNLIHPSGECSGSGLEIDTSNTPETFQKEQRYIVIKLSDLEETKKRLTATQFETFEHVCTAVAAVRVHGLKKQPLECVVVESDWPEYGPTWKAIEDRVNGE